MCALLWCCGTPSDELEKQELALYNDVFDQLAWQADEACSKPNGLSGTISSKHHGDSVKLFLREQPEKRVLHYQSKIGAPRKTANLADWIEVEVSSWERFFSTFSGTKANQVKLQLGVSSTLDVSKLHVDYMNLATLDTASNSIDSLMTVVRFSKPFYHKERNRAVLYFESHCGDSKARGELLMLRLKESKWLIEERRSVWTK